MLWLRKRISTPLSKNEKGNGSNSANCSSTGQQEAHLCSKSPASLRQGVNVRHALLDSTGRMGGGR